MKNSRETQSADVQSGERQTTPLGPDRSSPIAHRSIYLTFDDGPDPEWTPRILDVLAQAQAIATFFAIGAQVRRAPALTRRVLEEGHAIGNHTFSHRHPWWMSERAARTEVRDGALAVSDVTGQPPRLFRPPHGRRRACMTDQAARQGEQVVMWDLSAIDWGMLSAPHRISDRLARAKGGDIVLMHDGRNRHNRPDELLQALPGFLATLKRRGLRTHVVDRDGLLCGARDLT